MSLITLSTQKNILISVPSRSRHSIYLPTIWGILKSYCSESKIIEQVYHWLEPIIIKGTPEQLLAPYSQQIDVLGLSCYCWNSDTNYALAQLVRKRFPNCLVIAGGPDPDYKNTNFFADHSYVDAIVLQDGEVPFRQILEQLALDELSLDKVPGLILPPRADSATSDELRYRSTGEPEKLRTFDNSPWLSNDGYFRDLLRRLREQEGVRDIVISWETDRGCPYSCTYCDWGSNTYSKVRKFSLDRLRAEVMWIGENKISIVSLTAANFGILPQDSIIVDYFIEANARYGYPKNLQWNNAKNNVKRVIEISEKAYAAGLIDFHVLSVQSLDTDVLAAMGRSNISKSQQLQIVDSLRAKHLPNVVQLIFGGPADSLDRFSRTLTDLMEWGIHDEYVTYPFLVLPNAPANAPAYREKWGIRTVTRYGTVNKRNRHNPLQDGEDRSTFIVSTNSFDENEYIDMYLFGRLIIALHNGGSTQFVARYLRQTHQISYHQFYTALIEDLFRMPGTLWHEIYQLCWNHLMEFFGEGRQQRFEQLELHEVPELDYLVNIEEYFLFKILSQLETFYTDLAGLIERRFGHLDNLDSLLSYQRALIIDVKYDRRCGRDVVLQHEWVSYFQEENRTKKMLLEPARLEPPVTITIKRSHSGSHNHYPLDWCERSSSNSDVLVNWTKALVGSEYTRIRRTYFHEIVLSEVNTANIG